MLGYQEILFRHFGDTGASLWGSSIPKSMWKEFENVQKHFITKFLQVKKETSNTLLLKMGSLPIEIMVMERVVEHTLKVQKSPSHQLPRIAWEASKKIQMTHKSKILCSGWMQDLEARHLLHDASLDSSVNETFLQRQCILTWDKCGLESRFTHYITHVAPTKKPYSSRNGKTIHIDTC